MTDERRVLEVLPARPTREGAGVHLRRGFGEPEVPHFDPFLMLDDFRADRPREYLAGFPFHPHRGIETVTYMLEGIIAHDDSLGHHGIIGAGAVQWMTAGSGIIHQEMPRPVDGQMGGFQLWVNLPAARKMMKPRYQEYGAGMIPVHRDEGVMVRVVAGRHAGLRGPVNGIVAEPTLLDVRLGGGTTFEHPTFSDETAFAYVYGGDGTLGPDRVFVSEAQVARFGEGRLVRVRAGDEGVRFLFASGRPIDETVAWKGPIVMNTEEELREAFRELRDGTFVRSAGESTR
ncbi:MAG: pirin family protein [Methanoregulaceae archaeon]